MLLNLSGAAPHAPGLVGLLGECHQRIRYFSSLAVELARNNEVPDDERAGACERVDRYFRIALPLHVADEEESLAPRLRAVSPEAARALDTMVAQHEEHAPKLEALLQALGEVKRAPGDPSARQLLAAVAGALKHDFEAHLSLEESVIFPAITQRLSPQEQSAVIDELRQRRHVSLPLPA